MKKVKIQNNIFWAESIATTQEDNHHGVLDRFELFQNFNDVPQNVGQLIKYPGRYAVIHEPYIRYDFTEAQVEFIPLTK